MSRLGFAALNDHEHNNAVKSIASAKIPTRSEAYNIFQQLDLNNDGLLSFDEMCGWTLASNLLGELGDEDVEYQAFKLFKELDEDGSGGICFTEFYTYLKRLEREQKNNKIANAHYVTRLPAHYDETIESEFSFEALKKKLFRKIEQFSSQDTHRLQKTIEIFRKQTIRSDSHAESTSAMYINRREFAQVLSWLGLFASKKHSDELFDLFDVNGDGSLTVHEFLSRCRPCDYPGRDIPSYAKLTNPNLTEKKHFEQPPQDVILWRDMCSKNRSFTANVRAGLQEIASLTTQRELLDVFMRRDHENRGYLREREFVGVLLELGLPLDDSQRRYVIKKFGARQQRDIVLYYPSFVRHVFTPSQEDARHLRLDSRTLTRSASLAPLSFNTNTTYQASTGKKIGREENINLIDSHSRPSARQRPFSGSYPHRRAHRNVTTTSSLTFNNQKAFQTGELDTLLGNKAPNFVDVGRRHMADDGKNSPTRSLSRSISTPTFTGLRLSKTPVPSTNPPRNMNRIPSRRYF